MAKETKPKAIDLGALQERFNAAKRQYEIDVKALLRAQQAFDESRSVYRDAEEALKAAVRTVVA